MDIHKRNITKRFCFRKKINCIFFVPMLGFTLAENLEIHLIIGHIWSFCFSGITDIFYDFPDSREFSGRVYIIHLKIKSSFYLLIHDSKK